MPFLFEWLCELLEELHNSSYKRTLTSNRTQGYESQVIYSWYSRFNHKIERNGPGAIAFLSCLLPERRPDRVYNLQVKRLAQVFGRALGLGASRALTLNQWRDRDGADFPTCVERTLQECENDRPANGKEVTLEEIEEALDLIAAHAVSSSPEIRAKATNTTPADLLAPILRRLRSNEAKWLARILLKNYGPIELPEFEILHGFHFMLPNLLDIQNSFDAAITTLAGPDIRHLPPRPDKNYEKALQSLVSQHVQPRLGIMIKRQPYHKARSIKHCCNIANRRTMSVERKYDGEYCQIHIDMAMGQDCITIFSKSGKNSTADRVRLHTAIKDALRIGRNGCRIREKCIIEGELLVWNDVSKQIQPFHTIRKYVKHGGREIGTVHDSPKKSEEWLMIAFYDVLVLDDRMLLNKPNKIRRQYLKSVLQTTEGRAILGERRIIDFGNSHAATQLREYFAQAITQRWEGLVLKGLDDPYFSWNNQNHSIKLKRDYFAGLGNTADLCIIGARRDPHIEQQIKLGYLKWTCFYVGALCNMEEVRRFQKKPQIKVIDVLTHHSMPIVELQDFNRLGQLLSVEYAPEIAEFKIEICNPSIPLPHVLFKKPLIVEVMGAGFNKPSDASFFTLRFPRKVGGKVKLHTDRTLLDTMSFNQLQFMAEQSLAVPHKDDLCEDADWIEKIVQADGINDVDDSLQRDQTPAVTFASAATKSFSTVSPGAKSATPIFVRPDTEEPESRSSDRGKGHPAISKDLCGNPRLSDLLFARPRHNSVEMHKRRSSKAGQYSDDLRGSKRRYLKDIKNYSTRSTTSDLVVGSHSETVPLSREESFALERHVQDGNRPVTHKGYKKAFNPPAVFYSPSATKHEMLRVKEAVGPCDAQATPDSTLVMRQILSRTHRPSDLPTQPSPTTLAANKTSRHYFISHPQHSGPDHLDTHSLLLISPVSSPNEENDLLKARDATNKMPRFINTAELEGEELEQFNEQLRNNEAIIVGGPVGPNNGNINGNVAQPATQPVEPRANTIHPVLIIRTPRMPAFVDVALTYTRLSFTYNAAHFLDCVEANSGSTDADRFHIILGNHEEPEHVGALLITNVRREVQRRLTTANGLRQYNNRILLFSLAVLNHPIFIDGIITIGRLRSLEYGGGSGRDAALFLGVLEFFVREGQAEIGATARYEFGWTL